MNQQHLQTSEALNSIHQAIIDQELASSAKCINVTSDILKLWLEQYQCDQTYTLIGFLHLIKKYHLDPLADELSIIKNVDSTYQIFITIDGWYKIINQHHQFAGMSLRESTVEKSHVPIWMECTIYRNDRILPIVVKEYLSEVVTEHLSWKQMPSRMLRHRVIQQCARLAFGISSPEYTPPKNIEEKNCATNKTGTQNLNSLESFTQTERLKEKLANLK